MYSRTPSNTHGWYPSGTEFVFEVDNAYYQGAGEEFQIIAFHDGGQEVVICNIVKADFPTGFTTDPFVLPDFDYTEIGFRNIKRPENFFTGTGAFETNAGNRIFTVGAFPQLSVNNGDRIVYKDKTDRTMTFGASIGNNANILDIYNLGLNNSQVEGSNGGTFVSDKVSTSDLLNNISDPNDELGSLFEEFGINESDLPRKIDIFQYPYDTFENNPRCEGLDINACIARADWFNHKVVFVYANEEQLPENKYLGKMKVNFNEERLQIRLFGEASDDYSDNQAGQRNIVIVYGADGQGYTVSEGVPFANFDLIWGDSNNITFVRSGTYHIVQYHLPFGSNEIGGDTYAEDIAFANDNDFGISIIEDFEFTIPSQQIDSQFGEGSQALALVASEVVSADGLGEGVDVAKYLGNSLAIMTLGGVVSGTNPTIRVRIMGSKDEGATYPNVLVEFPQKISSDAGTISSLGFDISDFNFIRAEWNVGGTTPEFTIAVSVVVTVQREQKDKNTGESFDVGQEHP